MFKKCWATEKVHGTSTHISFRPDEKKLHFFHGGASRDLFLSFFNQEELLEKFIKNDEEHPGAERVTLYGEGYGGKMQMARFNRHVRTADGDGKHS